MKPMDFPHRSASFSLCLLARHVSQKSGGAQ